MTFSRSTFVGALAGVVLLTTAAAAQGAPAPAAARVRPAERVTGTGPSGATMRCRDGSYVTTTADDACAAKGGVLVRYPLRRVPEPPPERARVAAPTVAPTPSEAAPAEPAPASRANVVVPAERAPANATFLCHDGTYIVADTSRARCATRGGVRLTFPAKPRG